jgi:L-serine deaminase
MAEAGVVAATAGHRLRQHTTGPRVLENAAESAWGHRLGMTCDPLASNALIPRLARWAFDTVRAWRKPERHDSSFPSRLC